MASLATTFLFAIVGLLLAAFLFGLGVTMGQKILRKRVLEELDLADYGEGYECNIPHLSRQLRDGKI